jgi:thioredoxin 1
MKELTTDDFDVFVKEQSKVVVDFWAPWCMPCQMLAPTLEDLDNEMDGLVFAKVNVDEHAGLAQRFGIMSIPTLVVFSGGQEVDRVVGVVPKDDLKRKLTAA